MAEGNNNSAGKNNAKSGSPKSLKIALIIGIGLIIAVVVFRQVPGLKNSRFGRFVRKVTGAVDKTVTGGAFADAGDKLEDVAGAAKEGAEYLAEDPEAENKKDAPQLPSGSEPGISEGNLIEIEGANNHDACMTKAKEANYAGFAMKKGDDGKFTKCFGYTAEMPYPFTKELDTSYTACADPAMEVANSCAAAMEGDGEGSLDPPELNIEYPEDPKYILATGKGIEDPLDSAAANYTNFSKDINQCLQECNEDDTGCTGIQYTGEGECIIFDQTATFPTPNEYIDNENGALYKKILAPEGYKVDNPGKDYAGKPIMTLRNVDVAQCKKKCDSDKTCVGFSMYNSGKCQPKRKSALKGQLLTRPSGSTFYTKNAELMKPKKPETDGPASATDVVVQSPETAPVPSTTETYVPEWLNAKKKPKGKFLR